MTKKILVFIGIYWYLFPSPASASGEFYIKQNVDYKFDALGRSTITFNVSLTNKTANYYASKYELELVGEDPKNVTGRDSVGPLKIITSPTAADTTRIVANFNDVVAGPGKSLSFTLQYQGKPAVHNGQVWEINLPKLSHPATVDEYTLNLIVPLSFGQPAYLSPPPASSDGNRYVFTKDQLSKVGVVAAFGNFQTFSFRLKYKINTPSQIALPADTAYQRIFFDSITPLPNSVTADADGNWLAGFNPGEIVVTGQANLLLEPLSSFTDSPPEKYLFPTAYWPADNPQIKELAKSLKTPRKIYDYVVENLEYDYASAASLTATRKGALTALSSGLGVCTEFTDLFIALARAAGIPAREVNGYGYTTDLRLRTPLHSWPQYWDATRQVWVSVDPTWSRTTGGIDYFSKLDFNHLSFVTHGLSDSLPDFSATDIQVSYGSYHEYPATPLITKWQSPLFILPFIPSTIRLRITNPNSQAVYSNPVTLPPYGSKVLTVRYTLIRPFDFSPKSVTLINMTYNIPTTLFLPWQIGFAILISLTLIAGSLYLQKRFRPGSIRR